MPDVVKVTWNGVTVIDHSDSTVEADKVLEDYIAYEGDGDRIVGAANVFTLDQIASGNFSGDAVVTGTKIRSGAYRESKITSVSGNNVTTVGGNACFGCKQLTTINLPNVTDFWGNNSEFQGCTSLTTINMEKLWRIGNNGFYGCTSLVKVYLPAISQIHNNGFQNCTKLTHFETNNSINFSGGSNFSGCSALMTLIMRGTTLRTMTSVNNFAGTTFAETGSHLGHIYVPESMLSSYRTATNWSTLYAAYPDIFLKIEGSDWEDVHIDGTPVSTS